MLDYTNVDVHRALSPEVMMDLLSELHKRGDTAAEFPVAVAAAAAIGCRAAAAVVAAGCKLPQDLCCS